MLYVVISAGAANQTDEACCFSASVWPHRMADLTVMFRNSRFCPGQRFDGRGHVKTVGVNDVVAVQHDANMAGPEDQITPSQTRKIGCERQFLAHFSLHVGIPQSGFSGSQSCDLHKS